MNGMPHGHMRVGLVHFMAYPECMGGTGPVLETVRAVVKDTFFEVLEITHIEDDAVRQEVKSTLEQGKVTACYGAQPILLGGGLDLNHQDENERVLAIEAVKAGIDEAASMGIENLALLSGRVCDDYAEGKKRLVSSLKQLCAHGKPKGVNIVLETFDQVPFGKNCLIGPTKDAVEISEAVREDYPDFGFMLDLSHLPLIGESSQEAIALAGDHLVHAHIGNCAMDDPEHPAYGDNHPRFGAPGTRNDVPELAEFIRILMEAGYATKERRPVVSFEVKPMPGETSEAVLAGSKRALMSAWRMV